jgi:predicted nucleic acid-binding protein
MNAGVLDTSVLVAGLLSRRGAAAALVEAFFRDPLRLGYTAAILSEYPEVLDRPEFAGAITPHDCIGVLSKLRSVSSLHP